MKRQEEQSSNYEETEDRALTSEISIRTSTKEECSETCHPIIEAVCSVSTSQHTAFASYKTLG